jgi:hypothetical protein
VRRAATAWLAGYELFDGERPWLFAIASSTARYNVIVITRGRLDPGTRAYLQRKEAEGKTRIEAMRCLKRHLARRYHRLLLGAREAP